MISQPQVHMLEISMRLQPGQAIYLSDDLIRSASIANLPMLDRMRGARDYDVRMFVAAVEANWGVELSERIDKPTDYRWRTFKPRAA